MEVEQEAFQAWLREQGEGVAGYARGADCPLAYFLRHLSGGECWVVGGVHAWVMEEQERYELPAWAVAFAAGVDHRSLYLGQPVTGLEALEVLAEGGGHGG